VAVALSALGQGQILMPRWKAGSRDSAALAGFLLACDDEIGAFQPAVGLGKL
jgi:hypothetical protein